MDSSSGSHVGRLSSSRLGVCNLMYSLGSKGEAANGLVSWVRTSLGVDLWEAPACRQRSHVTGGGRGRGDEQEVDKGVLRAAGGQQSVGLGNHGGRDGVRETPSAKGCVPWVDLETCGGWGPKRRQLGDGRGNEARGSEREEKIF